MTAQVSLRLSLEGMDSWQVLEDADKTSFDARYCYPSALLVSRTSPLANGPHPPQAPSSTAPDDRASTPPALTQTFPLALTHPFKV
ncbi:uncharacterized protein SCHCODRAFT_02630913 [Schizophyllum commune H4-8]|uniref:uncharacterized protein n=1 Tax=Schizophyllum commune (strain H4-8 / FGSC 9210) TaxID=578458 RepID=UPI00215F848D|nr:uncharacterized protein SCHCODRAFT_02630913 [Schizophyllum commune H4-8]KAI5890120.1 hypothetical protein SCHCODRAFT_02630913 [Schizophyllum commune H4-8]